uniref:Molybdopterin biosynthesis protein n=1 Tax=Caloglossa beccarii TaxID=131038 RepID=A0A1Z1M9E5_9FLOR|nr:Molybdopterin biosynthesis protein [Caloglossa beccarii]ARW62364.1 Molybdopterin biosynthesis protein [Caloglossa beccarii]
MLNPNIKPTNLTDQEYILYAKHLIINEVGLEGQKRLKKAKILIIGAGGIGCPSMLYLASCGIGYIGIIDDDFINVSNLNRQVLYNFHNINQHKVISAKKRLKCINPYCNVITHLYKINHKNASEIIQYYDIILDATDNFETRYIIDNYCYKLHKIHIYSAVKKFNSQLSIFNYKNNIRYSNIYSPNIKLSYNNCNDEGILGFVTGHIGILQATETIKIILGLNLKINNYLLIFNLLDTSIQYKKIYFHNIKEKIKIKAHNTKKLNYFITKSKIKQNYKYKKQRQNLIIVDIRESYEFSKHYMKYAINIPIVKFKLKKTIYFLKKHQDKKIILYCNTAYRSLLVSNICKYYGIYNYIIKN